MNDKKIIFITGGAKSGKSSFALKEASGISGKKAYIATAEALDEEMSNRIEQHKRLRGKEWDTYEEPLRIAAIIKAIGGHYAVIVIDCLTLWLSNILHSGLDAETEIERLASSLTECRSSACIVSNEVGMGIVPENELARKFRDAAGMLNQKIAGTSDEVYMAVAGIPVRIK